jgi:hypothetical protein
LNEQRTSDMSYPFEVASGKFNTIKLFHDNWFLRLSADGYSDISRAFLLHLTIKPWRLSSLSIQGAVVQAIRRCEQERR